MFKEDKELLTPVKPEPEFGTLDHLIAWLEKQPGDLTYDWFSTRNCLMCQYGKACGLVGADDQPWVVQPWVVVMNALSHVKGRWGAMGIEHGVGVVACMDESEREDSQRAPQRERWTFGAALARARKLRDG